MNDLSCDRLSFFSSTISLAEKCKLASTLCDDKFDFVNFYKIGYCWIDGNMIVNEFESLEALYMSRSEVVTFDTVMFLKEHWAKVVRDVIETK